MKQSGSHWPQVPIKSPDSLACPTQSGGAEAPGSSLCDSSGHSYLRIQLDSPGCLRPGLQIYFFASALTKRSGSNTVLFLSMK